MTMNDKPWGEHTAEELAKGLMALCEHVDPCGKCRTCEAARRLREMGGERIEGWAWPTDIVDKEAFDNGNIEAKWLSFELWKNREELVEAVRATGDTIHHVTVTFHSQEIDDDE